MRGNLDVTDRAYRYRANRKPPAGPRQCALCGSRRYLVVDHKDGHEENGAAKNKRWLCKSCNTALGHAFARTGRGRRTRQFNPKSKPKGAANLAQWTLAVMSMHGQSNAMTKQDAIDMIHATPQYLREEYNREIWERRRSRGTDRTSEVPF